MSEDSNEQMVIDPRQLVRIESVHRGFLYQHLYAAECLLRAGSTASSRLVVERDEDIELVRPDHRLYIQIKTRAGSLAHADVEDVLRRFAEIRRQHEAGERSGRARFLIASNAPPSRRLADMLSDDGWPDDVELNWPDGPNPEQGLPRPSRDVVRAAQACVEVAGRLPFALLRPETLLWKLAGSIMLAATGTSPRSDHSFSIEELPALFEQLVIQLQDVPAPPLTYRAQINEPPLHSEDRVRVLCGLSGAGKTAWVAEAAVHSATPIIYMDVSDIPGAALAAAVAREVAARIFGRSPGALGEILLPGASPLETLGTLSDKLGQAGANAQVVLDNAHEVPARDIYALLDRAQNLHFLLICQPGPNVVELEALLGIRAEALGGWDEDTISATVAEEGCVADYQACEHLSRITGALPFYVLNAASIATREYGGSIAALCSDLDAQTHTVALAQEIIIRRAFDGLPSIDAETVGVLSMADVALSREDVVAALCQILGINARVAAARLRALPRSGMLELFGNSGLKIHDAVRPLGRAYIAERGADFEGSVLIALRDVVLASIRSDWSIGKLRFLMRLFSDLNQVKVLVEIATDELFHEMGVWPEIEPTLIIAGEDVNESPETRFWALDGLVFNDLREGNAQIALQRVNAMKVILDAGHLEEHEWLVWAMKRMLVLTRTGDADGVEAMGAEIESRLPDNASHRRIFRYNWAYALFNLGRYQQAAEAVEPLIEEYYDVLGISPFDVFGRNAPELRMLLPQDRDLTDDLKHLADTLDLHTMALEHIGMVSPFGRIHALKFYELAHALQSLVRVGQDLVDEFVARHDFAGARQLLERSIFPVLQGMGLVSWVVPVRAQYAVVLAYCGEHAAAAAEMARLLPYEAGLSDEQRMALRDQRGCIEELRRTGPPPQVNIVIPPDLQAFIEGRRGGGRSIEQRQRVGRNEKCTCGSGRKYKHCHGR